MDNLHMEIGVVLRGLKIVLAIVLSAALLLTVQDHGTLPVQAQPGPPLPPPELRVGDLDGNKIFDNLEFELAPAGLSERFPVISLRCHIKDVICCHNLSWIVFLFTYGFNIIV